MLFSGGGVLQLTVDIATLKNTQVMKNYQILTKCCHINQYKNYQIQVVGDGNTINFLTEV